MWKCGMWKVEGCKCEDVGCGMCKLRAVDVEIPEVHYHIDDILLLYFSPS